MMAEFEELRINVKTQPEKAGENARELQAFFRHAGDVSHVQNFEKLGRQFRLNDEQIKQLGEALGKQQSPLNALATGFGKAGFYLLAFEAALKVARVVTDEFNKTADRAIQTQHLANRMGGIHAAQVEENLKAMERAQIERGQGAAMLEKFNEKFIDFQEKSTGFKDSILKDVTGPFVNVVEQHFQELREAPDIQARMNLVRRFAEEINKYYVSIGRPEKGAQERAKYLERWFGSQAIAQMKNDFVNVSEETKKAWDNQQKVLEEYWTITTKISQNWNDVMKSLVTTTLEDLGINTGLIRFNAWLESAAHQHDIWSSLSSADRAKLEQDAMVAMDRYRKEHGFLEWLKLNLSIIGGSRKIEDTLKDLGVTIPAPTLSPGAHLFEDYGDNNKLLLDETKRLVTNLAIMNSYLALQAAATGGTAQLPYHNAPMGGAIGESNPIQLPHGAPQPGGGAATEARDPYVGRSFQPTQSTIYYTGPSRTGGEKTRSVTYTDPGSGETYTDRTKPIGPPSLGTALDETPGMAFGYRNFPRHGKETLGGYYLVTPREGPNAGQSYVLLHSDIGPGAGRGQKIDYNAPAAKMVFGSMREQDVRGGAFAQYVGRQLPKDVFPGQQTASDVSKFNLSPAHTQFIEQEKYIRDYHSKLSGDDGGGDVSDRGRRLLDTKLSDELNISGNLNVRVNAPAGVNVRASGEGLLKNVSLDRSMDSDFAGAP